MLDESLPFVDLAMKEKGQYRAALFTDDDLYFDSISTKEMHVYKPFTLNAKNWKFMSFTSREYWQNPEGMKSKIQNLFLKSKGN